MTARARGRAGRGRREDDRLVGPEPDAAAHAALELQRAAGNRAVAGLVQRQGGGFTFNPVAPRPPDLRLPPTSPLGAAPPRLSAEAAGEVRTFLEGRRYEIGNRVGEGTISMPEVVQMAREAVPKAAAAPVADIERVVREVFGALAPPAQRRKRTAQGAGSEIAARIANALSFLSKLRIDFSGGSIRLTASGLVASAKVGGATVTATGTPGGGEVKAEKGSGSVAVTGEKDAFGLTAKLDRASVEAKIERDETAGTWSKWELGIRVALVGDEPLEELTDLPELKEAVEKAEAAIRGIVAHLESGGSPADPRVKELMKDVKPAVEGVKRRVEAPQGPRVTVGATAKGGDERLGTVAGLSLIVEF